MSISDILRSRRSELGLTLKEISIIVGVSEATVQRWESGNIKNLRQDKIAMLASALRLSPAQLMGWDEPPSTPVTSPPYSCRHTTGNSLAMSDANIPAATIQAVMRQRRFTTTQRYIHPDTKAARGAVDKLKK